MIEESCAEIRTAMRQIASQLATLLLLALLVAASNPANAETRNVTIQGLDEAMLSEKRLALVIGNASYKSISPLRNPVNDANDMAQALGDAGFEVIKLIDADEDAMERAIVDFGLKLEAGGVGLFYYAGHGVQVDGRNYMIPLRARIARREYIRTEAVDVGNVLQAMAAARNRLNIVILDACRNNPFPQSFRSLGQGLAQTTAPRGTFVAYATAPGELATDGHGRNSIFTDALIEALQVPGLTIENAFKRVRGSVLAGTGFRQVPWTSSSITGDFYFRLPSDGPAALATALSTSSPPFAIEDRDETLVTLRNSNVRSAPETGAMKLTTLSKGNSVAVTGRVRDRDWLRVALADGQTGFIWAKLLGEKPTETTPAQAAPERLDNPFAVVLDSGLTLGDWALLAEDRMKQGEYVALLAEADKYRRQYGSFSQLDGLVAKAALADVRRRKGLERVERAALYRQRFGALPGLQQELDGAVKTLLRDVRTATDADARAALTLLARLEQIAGPSLPLLERQAEAHHALKDYDLAALAYRAWIGKAPADNPERRRMALGLIKAQRREAAGPQIGRSFKDCDDCPEMLVLPAGSFAMGSLANELERDSDEGPQRRVTIIAPFAVGRYEITLDEWDACVASGGCNGYRPDDEGWGRGRRPVINVSWRDAKAYVFWLSRRIGHDYRLLSETEWEYAARAGTTTPFHTGERIAPEQANFDGNYSYNGSAQSSYRGKTVPVGSFPGNAYGLHDMHGNVWEWTEDCYSDSFAGAPTESRAWTTGDCQYRVLRGGSWYVAPSDLRSANRFSYTTVNRTNDRGFRVARMLSR